MWIVSKAPSVMDALDCMPRIETFEWCIISKLACMPSGMLQHLPQRLQSGCATVHEI